LRSFKRLILTTCPTSSELELSNGILLWVQTYAMSKSSSETAWHRNSKSCLIIDLIWGLSCSMNTGPPTVKL